jgi:sugar fermentation stimulation protein A
MLIPHASPLLEGRFRARYDRFIAVISIDGTDVEAHCVNPGRMEGLIKPGSRAWVSRAPQDSKRKLRYTLELLEIDGVIIGANTIVANRLAEAAVRARLIPGMKRFRKLEREVPYGLKSRIDLLLTSGQRKHYVEVKNCHLVYPDGGAYFPDSVSTRATGHLEELGKCISAGHKASVLFVVQREDGQFVRPSALHDPKFSEAARQARAQGVGFFALQFCVRPDGFVFLQTLPVDLKPYAAAPLSAYRDSLAPFSGWTRRGQARARSRQQVKHDTARAGMQRPGSRNNS